MESLRGAGVADGVEGVLVLFCVGIFSVRCGMKSGGGFTIGKSAGEKKLLDDRLNRDMYVTPYNSAPPRKVAA